MAHGSLVSETFPVPCGEDQPEDAHLVSFESLHSDRLSNAAWMHVTSEGSSVIRSDLGSTSGLLSQHGVTRPPAWMRWVTSGRSLPAGCRFLHAASLAS